MSAVKKGKPLRGTLVPVGPTHSLDGLRGVPAPLDGPLAGREVFCGFVPLSLIKVVCYAPVERRSATPVLAEKVTRGWDRRLAGIAVSPLERRDNLVVVHLSTRRGWRLASDHVDVFDNALILDGARRLERAVAAALGDDVAVFVVGVIGLTPKQELSTRGALYDAPAEAMPRESLVYSGEQPSVRIHVMPRLRITAAPLIVQVVSEPFLQPTVRGYAPAIEVTRPGSPTNEVILIGAQSLSHPLEDIRIARGILRGTRLSIRKASNAQTAPYVVSEA